MVLWEVIFGVITVTYSSSVASGNVDSLESVDSTGLQRNNTDFLVISDSENDIDDLGGALERAKKKSCLNAGGVCISRKKGKKSCKGDLNKKFKCYKKKHVCCISDEQLCTTELGRACVPYLYRRRYTATGRPCVAGPNNTPALCGDYNGDNTEECYYGPNNADLENCGGACSTHYKFNKKHICLDCTDKASAVIFMGSNRKYTNSVFGYWWRRGADHQLVNNGMIDWAMDDGANQLLEICRIPVYVPMWKCKNHRATGEWSCKAQKLCSGGSTTQDIPGFPAGHLLGEVCLSLSKVKYIN